jgi:hypothetical protein
MIMSEKTRDDDYNPNAWWDDRGGDAPVELADAKDLRLGALELPAGLGLVGPIHDPLHGMRFQDDGRSTDRKRKRELRRYMVEAKDSPEAVQ